MNPPRPEIARMVTIIAETIVAEWRDDLAQTKETRTDANQKRVSKWSENNDTPQPQNP